MGKAGIVLGIGVVAAVGIAGYAIYRNAGKIGDLFSSTIQGAITNPINSFFENIQLPDWSGTTTEPPSVPTPPIIAGSTVPLVGNTTVTIPAETLVNPDGTVTSPTPPILNLPPEIKEEAIVTQKEKAKENLPDRKAGYYYFNFLGSKYDYQAFLTADRAKEFALAAAPVGDAFLNIKYTGAKLSKEGFQLFGKSQNYL